MLLEDRIAIVSGIGPGMGRDVSLALAREGAHVVLAARTPARLEELAPEIEALGRRALCVRTDITKPADCHHLAEAAHAEFGRIDVLVNNAFLSDPHDLVIKARMDDWRKIFDVNVFGSIQLTQEVARHMKEQRSGSIIMINTMSMRIIAPFFGGYAASKGALMAATQTLAKEMGRYKVRVNSVVPGYIWGESLAGFFKQLAEKHGTTPDAIYAGIAGETALNHIPTSEEIAGAVVFFASDLSRVITGQALDVNAGHYFH